MKAITYSAARENFSQTMKSVCENHDPVIVTSKNDRSIVMISLEDFEALQETAYLMRSPKNLKRLITSIVELEKGKGKVRKIAA